MLQYIDHIQLSVPIGSEEQVRQFYGQVLGLTEIPKPEALLSRGGLWMVLGNIQLHFGVEDVADRHKSKRHIAFVVDDLQAVRAILEQAGIQPLESIPIPGCQRFECRDPFGNRLEFMQKYT